MGLPDDRMRAIVALYRAGDSYWDIGTDYDISGERVRQILDDYEKRTGDLVPRRPIGGRRGMKVEWQCPRCKTARMVNLLTADRWEESGHLCAGCATQRLLVPEETITKQIAERLSGKFWTEIAAEVGRPQNGSAYIQSPIYRYLLARGDVSMINRLWPRGIPAWLENGVVGKRRVKKHRAANAVEGAAQAASPR